MRARGLFVTALLVAAPGLLWQAFEMYGLTLRGSQMLFFSIVHTMPIAVVAVLLAVPAGIVVLVQAAIGLLRPDYAQRIGMTKRSAGTLAMFLSLHFTALVAYDVWAPADYFRVPICIVGIALLVVAAANAISTLGNPVTPAPHGDA